MKITVKNFGPIREAKDIRISPLTLFVGPSNTGKSYLAIVICAAVGSTFNSMKFRQILDQLPGITKANVGRVLEKMFVQWLECMRQEWKNHIVYYLGEEGSRIVANRNMSVELALDDGSIVVDLNKPNSGKIGKAFLSFTENIVKNRLKHYPPSDTEGLKDDVLRPLYIHFADTLWHEFSTKFHFLPAARGGAMKSYRAITDKALEKMPLPWEENENASPMISGVSSVFVRQLIGINKEEHGDKNVININKILESDILHGRINVKFPTYGLPDFRYAMKGKKYDMAINNVSESVAELASLSVFMRYYLRKRSLLVFEEPETNLHPQAQQDIADIMVRLANAGVFVLATTHSTVVLEQISNAFRASQFNDAEEGRELLGKNREPLGEELAVYSFMKKSGGMSGNPSTMVTKTDFNSTTGILTEDHMDVSRELYDQTVNLVNGQNDE